ncbi:MAG: acetyl-CoA C-acetyltransferase [Thermomicrobiales bacterium]|nr:acetyl-CoA C-acetyltransferase [Thermomicrobiales bacterium]
MSRSVILSGARTPFGKLGGELASKSAVELGTVAATAAIERAGLTPDRIEHTVFGQVLQGGAGQNPARQVMFAAGVPKTSTAETVNRVCGSGMRAITLADQLIRLDEHQVILAGGMESMSNAPYLLRKARAGYRMGDGVLEDMLMSDGLMCAVDHVHMGIHGGTVAAEESLSREAQDAFALRSHERAVAAIDSGRFADEIVPVEIIERRSTKSVSVDESPRRDTTAEALAKLKPAFAADQTVTAGNAPGVNDGAAAVIVASEAHATADGLNPLATILANACAGWGPAYLAYTPAMASELALKKAGLTVADVDLWEINEAFASVPLISAARLGIDLDKLNVNGGAVALGHPIGASGARIVITLINELRRRGGGIGVAAICSGGGQGDAIVLQVEG